MKRVLVALIIGFGSLSAWSQSAPISGFVLDQYGSPVAGAQVYICSAAGSSGLPCTPVASIFQDYNLTIAAANPTQTDANGNFNVYVGALPFPNTYVVNMVVPIRSDLHPTLSGSKLPVGGMHVHWSGDSTILQCDTIPLLRDQRGPNQRLGIVGLLESCQAECLEHVHGDHSDGSDLECDDEF